MVKEKKESKKRGSYPLKIFLTAILAVFSFLAVFGASFYLSFENMYRGKVYPGVTVDSVSFGGKSPADVENYFEKKNKAYDGLSITLSFEENIATLSSTELKAGYDSKLSSTQAYSVGRSGSILTDLYQKWLAKTSGIHLSSVLTANTDYIDETLRYLGEAIDKPAEDALFKFSGGKVTAFKPSVNGLSLNQDKAKNLILTYLSDVGEKKKDISQSLISLPVEIAKPEVTTESSNNLGLKDLLGVGESRFAGSITGRIHNIELAASRLNGRLIAPGEIFSFNNALGDVSAATGYQSAYIIKDGRTVLGDGGGVCQVSTTMFRAALNSGLPIVERWAHSYRVSYYEQGFPPGIDATVFDPSNDLKFKNNTPAYILIQAKTDTAKKELSFSLYGTSDGRIAELTKPVILSTTPPPPDLYQDDPTLPVGTVKQVDWKAWGAKVNFDYKVTRDGKVLFQKSFFSNYQPWQAVFLRGTKT